jgi:hypothetical protein
MDILILIAVAIAERGKKGGRDFISYINININGIE